MPVILRWVQLDYNIFLIGFDPIKHDLLVFNLGTDPGVPVDIAFE